MTGSLYIINVRTVEEALQSVREEIERNKRYALGHESKIEEMEKFGVESEFFKKYLAEQEEKNGAPFGPDVTQNMLDAKINMENASKEVWLEDLPDLLKKEDDLEDLLVELRSIKVEL